MSFIIYLLIGTLSGLLAGMLGIGGGVVIVPALAAVFAHYTMFPNDTIMQMAIGTSLAIVALTLIAATRSHAMRGTIRWEYIPLLLPGLIIGTFTGSYIAHLLNSNTLKMCFGIFLFFVAIHLMLPQQQFHAHKIPNKIFITIMALLTGLLASMVGIAGGILIIPFLMYCKLEFREATGTFVICGAIIAFIGALSYLGLGLQEIHAKHATGYIYWPAFAGVALSSVLFAPVGAYISYRLPTDILRKILAVCLFLIGIQMLF